MTAVQDLYVTRSRQDFAANDITLWVVDVLRKFYGVPLTQVKTEVVIKGKSRGRADLVVQDLNSGAVYHLQTLSGAI